MAFKIKNYRGVRNTPAEMALWKRTPKDYRGIVNGVRMVLHMNPETGATELWPLSAVYSEEMKRALNETRST